MEDSLRSQYTHSKGYDSLACKKNTQKSSQHIFTPLFSCKHFRECVPSALRQMKPPTSFLICNPKRKIMHAEMRHICLIFISICSQTSLIKTHKQTSQTNSERSTLHIYTCTSQRTIFCFSFAPVIYPSTKQHRVYTVAHTYEYSNLRFGRGKKKPGTQRSRLTRNCDS
jgi:hypothetical protein